MKTKRFVVCGFLTVCGLLISAPAQAADVDPFAALPASCAEQARVQHGPLKKFRAQQDSATPQGFLFWDRTSAGAASLAAAEESQFTLHAGFGRLLYRGASNTVKPRISNQESKQAQKIKESYDSESAFIRALIDYQPWTSKKADHYKCVTDRCPQGASCTVIDVQREGAEMASSLPILRSYAMRTFRWAKTVEIFGSKVTRRQQAYDRREAELKQILSGLPTKLVVIDVVVPLK
jgi:hypothetical protein